MSSTRWERMAAATGILYFIVTFIGFTFFDVETPSIGSSADKFRDFWSTNQSRIGWSAALTAIGVFFLFWFIGALRSRLAAAEPEPHRLANTAFGGGIAWAAGFLAAIGISGQVMFVENLDKLSDATIETLGSTQIVSDAFIGLTTISRAVALGAVALCVLRYGGLPKWLGWVTGLVAALSLVGIFAITESTDGVFGTIWFIAFMASFFWVLLASIVMTVQKTGSDSVPAPAG